MSMRDNIVSYNPATEKEVWQARAATDNDIHEAIEHARTSFSMWKKVPFDERVRYIKQFANLVDIEKESLAKAISEETGKPLWESIQEVQAMKNKVDISLQAYKVRCPTTEQQISGNIRLKTQYHPHGVVAVFGPFNFPGHLPNGHIVPALLAGNCVIFKPSELTPHVGEVIASLWKRTGIPDGVFALLQGGKEVAITIGKQAQVTGIFFTGSVAAGQAIARQALEFPGRLVALEMGGNNPLIVSKVGNIKAAVYAAVQSAYITSGQRCSAARRLIVINNEPFIDELLKTARKLRIGAYTDTPEPYMGPVISAHAMQQLLNSYDQLLQRGGKELLPLTKLYDTGYFLSPGIVDMTGCQIEDAELFGPLLQYQSVSSLDEAIALANDTQFGLSAGILSDSHEEFLHFYEESKAGVVNWNTPTTGASSLAPFGGIGKSGNHRPSSYLACDYCAYPVASQEAAELNLPLQLPPGFDYMN